MDPALAEKITQTFVAIDAQDSAGKAVLHRTCLRTRQFALTSAPRVDS
jgi:hypothetical protein